MIFIKGNAKAKFLELLKDSRYQEQNLNILLFKNAELSPGVTAGQICNEIKDKIRHDNHNLFHFFNNDLCFTWVGPTAHENRVKKLLLNKYGVQANVAGIYYYNTTNTYGDILAYAQVRDKRKGVESAEGISTDLDTQDEERLRRGKIDREKRSEPVALIIEDQFFSRSLLKTLVSKHMKCIDVENGEQAKLEYIKHVPDVTFIDLELPDLNGHDLSVLFNDLDESANLVIVTGNNSEEDMKRARANGIHSYILKPYNPDEIIPILEQVLPKKAQSR